MFGGTNARQSFDSLIGVSIDIGQQLGSLADSLSDMAQGSLKPVSFFARLSWDRYFTIQVVLQKRPRMKLLPLLFFPHTSACGVALGVELVYSEKQTCAFQFEQRIKFLRVSAKPRSSLPVVWISCLRLQEACGKHVPARNPTVGAHPVISFMQDERSELVRMQLGNHLRQRHARDALQVALARAEIAERLFDQERQRNTQLAAEVRPSYVVRGGLRARNGFQMDVR